MIDKCGRNIDYLRVSVTDRCNLRCMYCMPEEGIESISHTEVLSFDEIARICEILAHNGLKKIKLTGGEPLVRKGISNLVYKLKHIQGIENVTITTNGVLLSEYYDSLVEAGIDAITVSLDTLDAKVYEKITRRDQLSKVLSGLKIAIEKGNAALKINCVPVLGIEEQEIFEIVNLARDNHVDVRFIEIMPIGMGIEYKFTSEEKIRQLLEKNYGEMQFCKEKRGNGPAEYYTLDGFKGKIGFVSSVSHKFCHRCNRVRLTADGFFKTCLQYDYGSQLKTMLRSDCTDDQLLQEMLNAIDQKPKEHNFDKMEGFIGQEYKKMSQIGG